MEIATKNMIIKAIETILERNIPNELKAHRVFIDIMEPALIKQKDMYEALFFVDDNLEQ